MQKRNDGVDLAISSFDKIKSMIKDQTRESMERLIDLNNPNRQTRYSNGLFNTGKKWQEGTDLTSRMSIQNIS